MSRVKFFADFSEGENTCDDSSQVGCPSEYEAIPVCSETGSEKGEETEIHSYLTSRPGPSNPTAQAPKGVMQELSSRSRAKLKQNFDDVGPYSFPVGHPMVAFTEPQAYHLLRVLTDEAINMSCSTVEKMVIGAVKGTPATAASRTEQFRTRTRAQTARYRRDRDTSSREIVSDPDSERLIGARHRGPVYLQRW